MAEIDFSAAYRDATKGSTIKALQQRRAEAQAAIQAAQQPRQIGSPWQGAAQIGEVISGSIREGRLANQEAASRQRFAQLLAGGLAPDEIGEALGLDPETGMKFVERNWATEDAKKTAAEAERVRLQERGWSVSDAEQRVRETIEQEKRAAGREETINTRETGETIASENRAAGREETINTRETGETIASENRAAGREETINTREQGEVITGEQRKAEAGAQRVVTGPEAAKLGGDPNRQYRVSADQTTLEDITPATPAVTYTYRPATPEERTQYNVPESQGLKMKVGSDGSVEPEGVGGGVTQPPPPSSETAGRLGLMTDYLEKFPEVIDAVKAGELTGPKYLYSVTGGYGKGGEAARIIETGAEALIRNLTGMGMPASEEAKYRKLYQPGMFDTAEKLEAKLRKLRTDLINVREGSLSGRRWDEVIDPAILEDEAPAAAPAAAAAGGGKPADVPQEEWDVMTPEEKAAFQ